MNLDDAIRRADGFSPFLRGLLRREEDLLAVLRADGFDAALQQAISRLDEGDAMRSLREARSGVALVAALADLAGAWPLERVTAALTRFADRALDFAIAAAFAEQGQQPAGLAALALGKMGSFELNYSSDIDLIFLHDPELLPRRGREEPTEAAVRLVRRVVALLSERRDGGYAFRVDLRLRPDPDSTAASLPYGAAVSYYQSQALAWERSAFIRARAAAGDLALGRQFLAEIEPFLWRRSLDYSAIAEIREISHRIRDHFAEAQTPGPGFDLKRGRGGIREVEFHAQVQQLIFGGRDPSLRPGATLDALAALARAGKIPADDAATLAAAYRHLRTLEHRIQMLADQQTHCIPKLAAERKQLAGLCGAPDWKALETALLPHLKAVGRLYDRLLQSDESKRGERIPRNAAEVEQWAARAGIRDPALLRRLLAGWRTGRPRSLRAPESLQAFEAVIPGLLAQLGGGRSGRDALLRFDQMIQALPSGVQFWRLLAANPNLAEIVGRVLTATPVLADALARRPVLLDILLQPVAPLGDVDTALAELLSAVGPLEGEALLDRVRQWTSERRFQLGVQLLDAAIPPRQAAREMAIMAEATVMLLAGHVSREFQAKYGEIPGGRLVPLALGRFGGGELTSQSDLDLILLFSGSFETRSTATPSLSASAWFNRLGQRLIAALTAPTAAGTLYAIDSRLRPSGADGLLSVSLDSFERYQLEQAGLLEQMAMTRARPIACAPEDSNAAQAMIDRIVAAPREAATMLREAAELRRYMAKHKPPAGPFDVKLMRGGLVDLEFIVQTRALLARRPIPPSLDAAIPQVAAELAAPARLMMDMLVMLRLVQPHGSAATPDSASAAVIARACGRSGFGELKADLAAAREIVQAEWSRTFTTD